MPASVLATRPAGVMPVRRHGLACWDADFPDWAKRSVGVRCPRLLAARLDAWWPRLDAWWHCGARRGACDRAGLVPGRRHARREAAHRVPATRGYVVAVARQDIQARVRRAAEQALAEQQYVRPIDVLLGLGWLAPAHLDRWRQGRVPYLEQVVQGNLGKVGAAMAEFRRWARASGLTPSETAYLARTRDRRQLRFSASGDPGIEQAYRTHWVSPALSERRRERLVEQQSRPPDLVAIAAIKPWTCIECRGEFGAGAILMMEDAGPHCMDCADLGHLEYLPAGNAALTRRAKKLSRVSAVVVRWSRARKRYERQGILAEPEALEQAEAEASDRR